MQITLFGSQIPNFTFPGVGNGELFERIAQMAVATERMERLGEALQVCRAMFTEDAPPSPVATLPSPTPAISSAMWRRSATSSRC
jgi:hypothetical protein